MYFAAAIAATALVPVLTARPPLESAGGILLLANNPQGGEHLKDLLIGQILWVSYSQLIPAALLSALNDAPRRFGTSRAYTCGHFPQSFELASVGGWILASGSGQASTYYGDACALVAGAEYVTPAGTIRTLDIPGTATVSRGPVAIARR